MEEHTEELSDDELARSLRFWAKRVYGGEREILEMAERRILKKAAGKSETSRNESLGCLVEILVVVLILRLLGCV